MTDDILYTLSDGRKLTRAMLTDTRPEASRNMTGISDEAVEVFNAGVECGRNNDIDGALEKFAAASRLEPKWPYPIYQRAFTLLLKSEIAEACAAYRQVDELEPRGFFSCKVALAVLEKEVAGIYPEGLYLYFLSHEWAESEDEKRHIMDEILTVAPDFAAAHQKLSGFTSDHNERFELIESGLASEPDAETRGMLLVNKAAILNMRGAREDAIGILAELVFDDTSAASAAAMAKGVLLDLLGGASD